MKELKKPETVEERLSRYDWHDARELDPRDLKRRLRKIYRREMREYKLQKWALEHPHVVYCARGVWSLIVKFTYAAIFAAGVVGLISLFAIPDWLKFPVSIVVAILLGIPLKRAVKWL